MSVPAEITIAEIDPFRFLRSPEGSPVELSPSDGRTRDLLALDGIRYRLARLHLCPGEGTTDASEEARFEKAVHCFQHLDPTLAATLLGHGRDQGRLYYATEFIDGEPLSNYLRRTGPLTEYTAFQLLFDLGELFRCAPETTREAFATFDPGRLLITDHIDGSLHFAYDEVLCSQEHSADRDTHTLVNRLTRLLDHLLGGHPMADCPDLPFEPESPPRSVALQDWMSRLSDDGHETMSLETFSRALDAHLSQLLPAAPRSASLPDVQSPYESWIRESLPAHHQRALLQAVNPTERYTFDGESSTRTVPRPTRFKILPNRDSLTHHGWMPQHQFALQRAGRPLPHQLEILTLQESGRCLVVGEAAVDGSSLETLLEERGPLPAASVLSLLERIDSALVSIESTSGAAPVWSLPLRNVFLACGNCPLDPLYQENLSGSPSRDPAFFLPVKLRLHQTMRDLFEGLDLPLPLLDLAHRNGKSGQATRRGALLLPLAWRLITGEPFDWQRPFDVPPSIEFSDSLRSSFERLRTLLLESPRRVNTSDLPTWDESRVTPPAIGTVEAGTTLSTPVLLFETRVPAVHLRDPVRSFPFGSRNIGEPRVVNTVDPDKIVSPLATRNRRDPEAKESIPADVERECVGSIEDPLHLPSSGRGLFSDALPRLFVPAGEVVTAGSSPSRQPMADDAPEPPLSFFSFLSGRPVSEIEPEPRRPEEPATLLSQQIGIWLASGPPVPRLRSPREPSSPFANLVLTNSLALDPAIRSRGPFSPVALIAGCLALLLLGGFLVNHHRNQGKSPPTLAETFPPVLRSDFLEFLGPSRGNSISPSPPAVDLVITPENHVDAVQRAKEDPRIAAAMADYYLPADPERARHWLRRSAAAGYADHQRTLGLLLARSPDSLAEAASWLQLAADQGDLEAQFVFGAALLHGHGVYPDAGAAVGYLEKASLRGDPRAKDLLGVCLAEGLGKPADPAGAFRHFHDAVEAGYLRSCYHLAVRYARGEGTTADPTRAVEIFRQGAEGGDPDCMHALGRCYESGFGVTTDLEQVTRWMKSAAACGQEDALEWCKKAGVPVGVAISD